MKTPTPNWYAFHQERITMEESPYEYAERIEPTPVLVERLRDHASTHSNSKDLLYAAASRLEELMQAGE